MDYDPPQLSYLLVKFEFRERFVQVNVDFVGEFERTAYLYVASACWVVRLSPLVRLVRVCY